MMERLLRAAGHSSVSAMLAAALCGCGVAPS